MGNAHNFYFSLHIFKILSVRSSKLPTTFIIVNYDTDKQNSTSFESKFNLSFSFFVLLIANKPYVSINNIAKFSSFLTLRILKYVPYNPFVDLY
jgi:hypothetical protein